MPTVGTWVRYGSAFCFGWTMGETVSEFSLKVAVLFLLFMMHGLGADLQHWRNS